MNPKIYAIIITLTFFMTPLISAGTIFQPNSSDLSMDGIGATNAITLTYNGQQKTYSIEDLLAFDSISGSGGKIKVTGTISGPFEYTGVLITTLAHEFPGLSSTFSLVAIADDGYTVSYTYDEIQGNVMVYDTEGQEIGIGGVSMILATMEDGQTDYDGAYRIAFINDDEPITDAPLWAKYIVELEFIDESTDGIPPTLTLEKPKNSLYLFDKELVSYSMPLIIGGITISVNAYDASGISRVLFVIDEDLKHETTTPPYQWHWDEYMLGTSQLEVIVYDTAGNLASVEKELLVINPF